MRSSFARRNPLVIGSIGVAVTLAAVVVALQYRALPFLSSASTYEAYFTEAGGLTSGAAVQVSGFEVGSVSSVDLDGDRVIVAFKIDDEVHLGDRTEAAIKTKSLLGGKVLEIIPRGGGDLSAPIPTARTTPPYQLSDAIGDLATTVKALDTNELSVSLRTLADTFRDTPPDLRAAVEGMSRFSQSLAIRDDKLRNLLKNADKGTAVLATRSEQIVKLVANTNSLLADLRHQSLALDQISGNISALARQLIGFVEDNKSQLRPALDKLNGVLTLVANHKAQLQISIKRLNDLAISLGESVSSGPFFNAYLANLLPGQFLQPFIDAAFSDLGIDPNVKLPSELVDPATGQVATPALPVPFPRTGQGGEPRLTVPDAITGNPDDPRYPFREPPVAPAPGSPPPAAPSPNAPDAGNSQPAESAPGDGGAPVERTQGTRETP